MGDTETVSLSAHKQTACNEIPGFIVSRMSDNMTWGQATTYEVELQTKRANECGTSGIFDGAKVKRTVKHGNRKKDIWVHSKVEGNVITMTDTSARGSQHIIKERIVD